ncbi:MAG: ATP12 family protein [Alphaproteobacteria bacterium]|nr:ATP12 family protein [Alphaproteobacteria bacterium]
MGIGATAQDVAYTTERTPDGYAILRSGTALKTYGESPLLLPNAGLAEAVAEEWRLQQPGKPKPSKMPLMQLAATALDITSKNRAAVIEEIMSHAATELLCYRAERPTALVERQSHVWQPILDWCALRFDAMLNTGQGMLVTQSPQALQALRLAVESYDNFYLTGLKHAAELSHSLVLGLAMAEQHMPTEDVFQAAELESLYQIERNGEDAEAMQRHEAIRNDLEVCGRWFTLLRLRSV